MRIFLKPLWEDKESRKAIKEIERTNARRKILATCFLFIFSEIKKNKKLLSTQTLIISYYK